MTQIYDSETKLFSLKSTRTFETYNLQPKTDASYCALLILRLILPTILLTMSFKLIQITWSSKPASKVFKMMRLYLQDRVHPFITIRVRCLLQNPPKSYRYKKYWLEPIFLKLVLKIFSYE